MDWIGCFDAGCCLLDIAFSWRLILIVVLAAAGGFGGWSIGARLDANWGTEFMALLLAIIGTLAGAGAGIWMLAQAREYRPPEDL